MELTQDIVENAARIAVMAHAGQKRKGSDTPYVVHPFMIALDLARHGFPDFVIAAALTHDVLEDTDFPPEELKRGIGEEAFAIVETVSHDAALSWEENRAAYIERVRGAHAHVKAVAAADKIHNAKSLIKQHAVQGASLWSNFSRSKDIKLAFERNMLGMLQESWDHALIEEYAALVEAMYALE